MPYSKLLVPINNFLKVATPLSWLEEAKAEKNLSILLIDHLICELKAAQSAMFMIRKYAVDKAGSDTLLAWLQPFETLIYKREGDWRLLAAKNKLTKSVVPKADSPYGQSLIDKMVLLIKEELHHFYQVLEIMDEYGVVYRSITPCRYAKGMLTHVKTFEPDALIDKLIVGAFIEARSCERFAMLAPNVDKRLGDFYLSLLRSEARHYQDYLTLAKEIAGPAQTDKVNGRIAYFAEVEAKLIVSPDSDFKFHSGSPVKK